MLSDEEVAAVLANRGGSADAWLVVIREGHPQALAEGLAELERDGAEPRWVLPNGVNRWTVIARRTGVA